MKAFFVAVLFVMCVAAAKAAPLVEAVGDMTVMVFNPAPVPIGLLLDGDMVAEATSGVDFALVPEGVLPNPFTVAVEGAGDDPFIYVDDSFPGLLFHWDNGVETSCTNCVISAIPIPASGILFASALMGIIAVKRKRG